MSAVAAAAQPPGRRRRTPAPPHRHDPLPDEPADWNGRQMCSGPQGCGLLGKAGDARHPDGAPPLAVARLAASLAAARLSAASGDVRERDLAIRRRFEPGETDD